METRLNKLLKKRLKEAKHKFREEEVDGDIHIYVNGGTGPEESGVDVQIAGGYFVYLNSGQCCEVGGDVNAVMRIVEKPDAYWDDYGNLPKEK